MKVPVGEELVVDRRGTGRRIERGAVAVGVIPIGHVGGHGVARERRVLGRFEFPFAVVGVVRAAVLRGRQRDVPVRVVDPTVAQRVPVVERVGEAGEVSVAVVGIGGLGDVGPALSRRDVAADHLHVTVGVVGEADRLGSDRVPAGGGLCDQRHVPVAVVAEGVLEVVRQADGGRKLRPVAVRIELAHQRDAGQPGQARAGHGRDVRGVAVAVVGVGDRGVLVSLAEQISVGIVGIADDVGGARLGSGRRRRWGTRSR